jgi:hypothetical protein
MEIHTHHYVVTQVPIFAARESERCACKTKEYINPTNGESAFPVEIPEVQPILGGGIAW